MTINKTGTLQIIYMGDLFIVTKACVDTFFKLLTNNREWFP